MLIKRKNLRFVETPAGDESGAGAGGENAGFTPPASQDELNRIIADRLSRERAKYADYNDLKTKAQQLSELTTVNEGLVAKVSELEAVIESAKEAKAFADTLAEVAKESGVPADVLRGSTREELEAHAETLKSLIKPAGPVVSGAGDTPGAGGDDAEREFIRELFGRND